MSTSEQPDQESTPDEIRAKFAPVASATDAPPPGEGDRLPLVRIDQPISTLARIVGQILHSAPIFLWQKTGLVTVDEEGELDPMTSERFTSWVENHLAFFKGGKDEKRIESIGKDLAAKIMAADQFKAGIRTLKAVSLVRLPVWCVGEDRREVRLAHRGFDAETGIYTVDAVPYPDDMDWNEACEFIYETFREFPYESEGQPHVGNRRSYSAQVAAMVGAYVHQLFPDGALRPMILWCANDPGSGKSLLMKMCLAPMYGPPAVNGLLKSETDLEKVLDTAANARKPYLVFDDAKHIESNSLNRFVTASVHEFRMMHSQRMASVTKNTQVFVTGNNLVVSRDIERRALIIDLFEPGDLAQRRFAHEITDEWVFSIATRAKFLAAMWAMVRKWKESGMPRMKEHRRASFEEWTGLVGGVVMENGFTNPFAPRGVEVGGDEVGRAVKTLLARLVGACDTSDPPIYRTDDLLDAAAREDLLEIIVGNGDPKGFKTKLGNRLKPLRGKHLVDTQGRAFEFGRRDLSKGYAYPIYFIEKPPI